MIARYGEEYEYQIESIKGPTEFNATGLPIGLEIDPKRGPDLRGSERDWNFPGQPQDSQFFGEDFAVVSLVVLKGRQSIVFEQDLGVLVYGDQPIDLNATSTSGLPIDFEIVNGADSIDLNGTVMTIRKPGAVSLLARQNGDANWLAAEPLPMEFLIMKKEAVVTAHDQFRSTTEPNPALTYSIDGLVNGDLEADFNQSVVISTPVADGNLSNPTALGVYPISLSNALDELYYFVYMNGNLTVSDKSQQTLVFDQNLTSVRANLLSVGLTGYSIDNDGNMTGLPLLYGVEDETVARIKVTRQEDLTAHWKLDEQLYSSARGYAGRLQWNLGRSGQRGTLKLLEAGALLQRPSVGCSVRQGGTGQRANGWSLYSFDVAEFPGRKRNCLDYPGQGRPQPDERL